MKVLRDFPGYTLVEDKDREFKAGDEFGVPYMSALHGELYNFYTLGSIASFAEKYGDDPQKLLERAKERGDAIYWANQNPVTITNMRPTEKPVYPLFELGEKIRFEGKIFEIQRAPNSNVRLVEVDGF